MHLFINSWGNRVRGGLQAGLRTPRKPSCLAWLAAEFLQMA